MEPLLKEHKIILDFIDCSHRQMCFVYGCVHQRYIKIMWLMARLRKRILVGMKL